MVDSVASTVHDVSDALFENALVSIATAQERKYAAETQTLMRECAKVSQRKFRLWDEIHSTLNDKKVLQKRVGQLSRDISLLRYQVRRIYAIYGFSEMNIFFFRS